MSKKKQSSSNPQPITQKMEYQTDFVTKQSTLLRIIEENIYPAVEAIVRHSSTIDLICLAAVNQQFEQTLSQFQKIKKIKNLKDFNLDIFPGYITKHETTAVNKIIPNLEKITISLSCRRPLTRRIE